MATPGHPAMQVNSQKSQVPHRYFFASKKCKNMNIQINQEKHIILHIL